MSVTGCVFFVDWDAVRDQHRVAPNAHWQDDWLYDEQFDDDEHNGWPPRFRRERYDPPEWIESWKCAAQADEYYRALRRDLSRADRAVWDRLFTRLLAINGDPGPFDLPGFEPNEGIANIFSPATVAEMAAVMAELDVDRLRPAFEGRCRPDPDYWLKNFDEFRDYIGQWFAAIAAARRSGKAMVLWVA